MKWTVVVLLATCGIACSLELEFPENFEELREFHDKRAEEPNPSDAGFEEEFLELLSERRVASAEEGSFQHLFERQQTTGDAGSCQFKGKTYKNGDTYKDACNTCRCVNGRSACTLMACPGCTHAGTYYNPRVNFKLDTANTCTCLGQDRIGCREMPIPGLPNSICYYKGRYYNARSKYKKGDKCNLCTCVSGNINVCSRVNCNNPQAGCIHQGRRYGNGQKFVDGCNACICRQNFLFCTELRCI